MKKDIFEYKDRKPQYNQADTGAGIQRAIVLSNRDPNLSGCVRAHIYGDDGEYKDLALTSLKWARPMRGLRGAFTPPEVYDRVLLMYDAGVKDSVPIIVGTWDATPMGDGTLCHNKRVGNEIRPEGWHHHDLYPESTILASSRNGNTIWMNDIWMNEKHLASSINLMDVCAKYMRIKSFKLDTKVWSPEVQPPKEEGGLYQHDPGENIPLRYGFESPDEVEEAAGSVEMGFAGLVHNLYKGEDDYTCDEVTQGNRTERAIDGESYQHTVGNASFAMISDAMFLNGDGGIYAGGEVLAPPRRWDL